MKVKILRFLGGIGLSLLSILLVLLLLECVVRLTTDFKSPPRARTHLPISTTYRLAGDPDLVYELVPGSRARVQGITVRINAAGFRDRHFPPKAPGVFRVIVVGDSITYGWNVALSQTFHKQLENRLRKSGCALEVLATGVVGYNTAQEFHLLRERVLAFQPDLVVLQIAPNDFERTVGIRADRSSGHGYTLIMYQDLRIPFVGGKSALSTWFMRHSHLFRWISLRLGALIKKINPDYEPQHVFLLGEEKSFAYLSRIRSLLRTRKIPWAAVIFPEACRRKPYRFAALHQRLRDLFRQWNVPAVDLFDALNPVGAHDLWLERVHPNAQGHSIAATRLLGFLRPMIPCRQEPSGSEASALR